jgi:hypothetical protein
MFEKTSEKIRICRFIVLFSKAKNIGIFKNNPNICDESKNYSRIFAKMVNGSIVSISVVDPDPWGPYVFGPSGCILIFMNPESGSFHQQKKEP